MSGAMEARLRLIAWRKLRGLTQPEAAQLLGCQRSMLAKLEGGQRRPGRRLGIAIERATADLTGGPIRALEWDPAERASAPPPTGTDG
jgi:transcriptional regulator with XRE-family HTH domain